MKSEEILILKMSRVQCRFKIAEKQRDYLLDLIKEKVPENTLEFIINQMDKIYEFYDEEYINGEN